MSINLTSTRIPTLISTGQQESPLVHPQYFPPMTHALPPQLYLLVPWNLPVEQPLSQAEQAKLSQALKQLLWALEQPSHQQALEIVNQQLATFELDHLPVQPSSTKTPLKPWEVEDFNDYFQVSHVQAQDSPACVVCSLLTAYQMFLELERSHHQSNQAFDPEQVKLLKAGLRSYVILLTRVFRLGWEETQGLEDTHDKS